MNDEVVKLLNSKEAANALKISTDHLRRLVKRKRIECRYVNGRLMFTASTINKYLGGEEVEN